MYSDSSSGNVNAICGNPQIARELPDDPGVGVSVGVTVGLGVSVGEEARVGVLVGV